jgi:putative FmdB family regulatory protein
MPLYEYLCEKCGGRFEVIQKFADEPVAVHEICGGSVHRLLSVPALKFKGSGFYINDYAKASSGGGHAGKDGGKESSSKESSGKDSGGKDKGGQNGSSENSKPASDSSPSKPDASPTTAAPAVSSSDKK